MRWKTIFLLLSWTCVASGAARSADIVILEKSETSLTLAYRLPEFQPEQVLIDQKVYQRITLPPGDFMGQPGEPMIPCRILVLAAPGPEFPSIEFTIHEIESTGDIRMVPVSQWVRGDEEDLPVESYEEGPAYRSGMFPQEWFELDPPGMAGDQWILRIRFYPFRYYPQENRIEAVKSATFRIRFPGSPARTVGAAPESWLRTLTINPDPGTRRPERQALRRSRPQFLGSKYKIAVSSDGLVKLTGQFLEKQGISLEGVDPSTIKIYNNGGRELPRALSESRPDSLIENPILLYGMGDNRFNPSDYILFFGRGTSGWTFRSDDQTYRHEINRYTDDNIYWLVFNDSRPGRRIQEAAPISPGTAEAVTTHREHLFFEEEINNPDKGGMTWFGSLLDNNRYVETIPFEASEPVAGVNSQIRYRVRGATSGTHQITVDLNGTPVSSSTFSGTVFHERTTTLPPLQAEDNTLRLIYAGLGSAPKTYVDWIELYYTRTLRAVDGKLIFESPSDPKLYEYRLTGFEAPLVLDITDLASIRSIPAYSIQGGWAFADEIAGVPRRYGVFNLSSAETPESMEEDAPSELRYPAEGADMILITHSEFRAQADRLKNHRESEGFQVLVADIEDVFDEFGWGLPDVTAVRDFVRHAFHAWNPSPRYLLLFGDGHYDYKNNLSNSGPNWIPPFEYEGLGNDGSRAADDWFVYVSPFDSYDAYPDLSVGRLPVQSASQAEAVVDKIIAYETTPSWGDWKQIITLVGDDEKADAASQNEVIHIRATEEVAKNAIQPLFNLKKIYLTEYPEVLTAEGRKKPQANQALLEQLNRGTLLVNYIGHGNAKLWAHESVFHREIDFPHVNNRDLLPLIYAATCSFGWYDNPEEDSFSEVLIYTEGKGAIAVIAACRLCNARYNEALNHTFLDSLFSENPSMRLGDALRRAKISTSYTTNNEMYHLFGDPALRLAAPRHRAVITQLPDTLRALTVASIKGTIEKEGQPWDTFQGTVSLRAFDSKKDVVYTTEAGTPIEYRLPGNAIFRGETNSDDLFEISFVIPKDISYGGKMGRITAYFWDGEADGAAYEDDIPIGGSGRLMDIEGPNIQLGFKGYSPFIPGGMVDESPTLLTVLEDDSSGINITGEIGHKIVLTLDESETFEITESFRYDEGSYLKGSIEYTMNDLAEGYHTLSIKAWDNANNSSTSNIDFRVVSSSSLRIEEVLNFPNPFDYFTETDFTFQISQDAEIEIKVYTVDGRLIKHIRSVQASPGFNQIHWDGRDERGDELANGVYLYRIIARSMGTGRKLTKEAIGRLMIMR